MVNRKTYSLLYFIILFFIFTLFVYSSPVDWFGILLVLMMFIYIYINKVFRKSSALLVLILMITIIRVCISFVNHYYFTIYGADVDTINFVNHARIIVQKNIPINLLTTGSTGFENYLAWIFKLTGVSTLTTQNLSIFAFLISIYYLLKISGLLGKEKYNVPILVLFTLIPSSLVYTSITMREPYQILFLLMSAYYLFLILAKVRLSILLFLKLLLSALALGMMHNGLLIYALILILVGLASVLPQKIGKLKYFLFIFTALVFIPLVMLGLNALNISTGATDALLKGDFTNYIESYRDGGIMLEASAAYNIGFDTKNIFSMLLSAPLVFINYMIAPFPWQVRGGIDLFAIFENTVRLLLFYGAFKSFRQIPESNYTEKRIYKYGLTLFITMEFLWALGTVNWGTAIRHHLVPYGIIVVLGIKWFVGFLEKILMQK